LSNSVFLSIVIPAYNEERRLPDTVQQICAFLEDQSYQAEILIVDNNSSDNTFSLATYLAEEHGKIRVIQEPQQGKGAAVRAGVLQSRGEYRFMCDADLSMPVTEITRFIPPALTDFDIAIASREAPGAIRYNEPYYRHLAGRIFNQMIRLLAIPHLQDTQCGFKCFRAPIAEELFSRQTLIGWSFDVELLFIAQKRGYRITELPIPWYYNADSRVRMLSDSIHMLSDLLKIRRNDRRGVYEQSG
jgi:glycosyltransferase involved in cell wall biosynthesis